MLSDESGEISVSQICFIVNTVRDLKAAVFPDLANNFGNSSWFCEGAILTSKNTSVAKFNEELLQTYRSIDTVADTKEVVHYPADFLNSGLLLHALPLKIGAPVMLLRNLEVPRLCNGTHLVVNKLLPHVIEATILTGYGMGEDVFIQTIPLTPLDVEIYLALHRLQFPL